MITPQRRCERKEIYFLEIGKCPYYLMEYWSDVDCRKKRTSNIHPVKLLDGKFIVPMC